MKPKYFGCQRIVGVIWLFASLGTARAGGDDGKGGQPITVVGGYMSQIQDEVQVMTAQYQNLQSMIDSGEDAGTLIDNVYETMSRITATVGQVVDAMDNLNEWHQQVHDPVNPVASPTPPPK